MKQTIKLFVAAVSIAVITISSCGKYEEGPGFSVRTKKGRLAGEWTVDKFLYNGNDVTSSFVPSGTSYKISIEKDGSWTDTYTVGSISSTDNGTWEFVEKKEMLKWVTTGSSDTDGDTLTILKLKNNELWFEEHVGSDHYEYHYKPVE